MRSNKLEHALFSFGNFRLATLLALILGGAMVLEQSALACGCFATPTPAVPLVQAGEEILFVVENGRTTMHVKIRYSGAASDFGWLLPLPAIPQNSAGAQGIDVGSDELFTQLASYTQPIYTSRTSFCKSFNPSIGCGSEAQGGAVVVDPIKSFNPYQDPLITQSTIGPYEYAILKADDKSAMLNWLTMNRYVVPAGIDGVVEPYIRPGAYFLALRLSSGKTAGDLQPVVLSYPSDLPMIPIRLTAVGASRDMGILVYVLGAARAIPRNYHHVVLNDSRIDIISGAKNYSQQVTRAVAETSDRHGFITDYAGTTTIMAGILDSPGRFSSLQAVKNTPDPVSFIAGIVQQIGSGQLLQGSFLLNGQFYAVAGAHVPMPQQLLNEGVTLQNYYTQINRYLRDDRAARPSAYADIQAKLMAFDPVAFTRDLTDRIVTPTLTAGYLFTSGRFQKLTRLYTTLSPEDMTADPVFSFNAQLPDVSNIHQGELYYECDRSETITTESQFKVHVSAEAVSSGSNQVDVGPAAQRIERLSDVGMPEVLVDNTETIKDALNMAGLSNGCAAAAPHRRSSVAPYVALCVAILFALRLAKRRHRLRA